MRYIMMTAVLFAAAVAIGPQAARADDRAPWCALYSAGRGNAYWDCQYNSFEQCYPAALANRGFCNHNPRYEGPPARPKTHGKRRIKQH